MPIKNTQRNERKKKRSVIVNLTVIRYWSILSSDMSQSFSFILFLLLLLAGLLWCFSFPIPQNVESRKRKRKRRRRKRKKERERRVIRLFLYARSFDISAKMLLHEYRICLPFTVEEVNPSERKSALQTTNLFLSITSDNYI
jgi:nitrate reductase NapE component